MRKLGLIYLASPYSKYPHGIEAAWEDVCEIAGRLMKKGAIVYSPIAHSHPIAMASLELDHLDHQFWMVQNKAMLDAANTLMIAKMLDWEKSEGIKEEIKKWSDWGKSTRSILYLNPTTLEYKDATEQGGDYNV